MRQILTERSIKDETGRLIGVVEGQPGVRGFFSHSIYDNSPRGTKFSTAVQAAIHIHVLHDCARDCAS